MSPPATVNYILNSEALEAPGPPPLPTSYGKLHFDIGEIDHPKYGRGRIQGTFNLILPRDDYRPSSEEGIKRGEDYIKTWMDEHWITFGDVEYRDRLIRVMGSMVGASHAGEVDEPVNLASVIINMSAARVDDIEEETGLFSRRREGGGGVDISSELSAMKRDILSGKYKEFEDLPQLEVPLLQPLISMGFLMSQLAPTNPEQDVNTTGLHQYHHGMMTLSDTPFIDACSEELYIMLRARDAGFGSFGEWMANVSGWVIEPELRANVICFRASDACARAAALVNDVLGIRKDLYEENPVNLVLRKIRRDGFTFDEALSYVIGIINTEMKDMILCTRRVLEEHEDHPCLGQLLEFVKHATEGHIRAYGSAGGQERYGKITMTATYDD